MRWAGQDVELEVRRFISLSDLSRRVTDDINYNRDDTKTWSPDPVSPILEGHTDWVRDVAWAPSVGVGRAYLASAGQVSSTLFNNDSNVGC